ncbi:MAG: 50S ribosomal protein L3 [Candidatus Doudnabacteria bacterium RIFCSPLOWO2_02_FULL_48_8]|uniref:50S ribosomal protein L3 n=1 Tax=Candidatus Doudnabacteria bacterium RIFCSPHIGHO2_01_FULL_46_24 TaxID=1817825 RepID=A0A1F5NUY2_9BACT|nr:ribosomal protein L3 [uncultured bacterium]OGE81477.1 MAG: 50S ribosomal protein L3 [Candidatus Doudnabacteria bacterium RIFCSPHIGHO2_01_FULL_46_24]OGE95069.1 MAG: 50S ribosomal protein L3 [Candidatus Doudnabacteria bacterium RIFCSPLOWO2_02_FULL_48_8]OGE95905.1 MAG: 50S ribosomal protein L3 [Candidatus Doudnabacteria bacterium RIFCSPHIGHO2_12_FULL_48_11]
MKFILAEKLNMSQIFKDGKAIPVTILRAGPVKVTAVKNLDRDKYQAVQVGFGRSKKRAFGKLSEFRVSDVKSFAKDQEIRVDSFVVGDRIKVTAEMKGRGFAGPIKKYGFKGAPASHGHDHPRAVGAIGGRFPQHVRKGLRMASRMGGVRTIRNLEVVDVDSERNLIAVKGAVPGARGGIVKIQTV